MFFVVAHCFWLDKSCPTVWPLDCSMSGFSVLHYLMTVECVMLLNHFVHILFFIDIQNNCTCLMYDEKSWFIGKDHDARRGWGQEEKGTTEDEMAGWHHRLNGHEFE